MLERSVIVTKIIFWMLLISAFIMGIYACLPTDPPPTRLLSVYELQTELVRRGHDIKIDGVFGKNTDHALTIEVTKERE
jgi:hypothetical protein